MEMDPVQIIHDYLRQHGYTETMNTLQMEHLNTTKQVLSISTSPVPNLVEMLHLWQATNGSLDPSLQAIHHLKILLTDYERLQIVSSKHQEANTPTTMSMCDTMRRDENDQENSIRNGWNEKPQENCFLSTSSSLPLPTLPSLPFPLPSSTYNIRQPKRPFGVHDPVLAMSTPKRNKLENRLRGTNRGTSTTSFVQHPNSITLPDLSDSSFLNDLDVNAALDLVDYHNHL